MVPVCKMYGTSVSDVWYLSVRCFGYDSCQLSDKEPKASDRHLMETVVYDNDSTNFTNLQTQHWFVASNFPLLSRFARKMYGVNQENQVSFDKDQRLFL